MSDEEGNVVDLSTRILMSIRDEIAKTRTELRDEIAGVSARVATLEAETIRGFTAVRHELDGLRGEAVQTNRRMDHLIETKGSDYRDHEARISALEGAVSRLSGR